VTAVGRDEIWVDMTQFDQRAADGVWDGTTRDPDAPPWYRDVRSLIHRARGPAEPEELVDEPVVVATMHKVRLGGSIARLPRSSGVRTLGRVIAMKAAAATTASVIGVAAAAAATTGIVATVAATVVVPVVKEHVVPMINDHIPPAVVPAEVASSIPDPARHHEASGLPCTVAVGSCGDQAAAAGPVGDLPVDQSVTDPAAATPTSVTATDGTDHTAAPAVDPPATDPPADPEAGDPVVTEPPPVDPPPTDPPPVDPPPSDPPIEPTIADPPPTDPPPVETQSPAVAPGPEEHAEGSGAARDSVDLPADSTTTGSATGN
jgi:hypothetical protein